MVGIQRCGRAKRSRRRGQNYLNAKDDEKSSREPLLFLGTFKGSKASNEHNITKMSLAVGRILVARSSGDSLR